MKLWKWMDHFLYAHSRLYRKRVVVPRVRRLFDDGRDSNG